MALTLAQFIAQYSGKTVGCGPGGSAGDFPTGQCTSLACLWTVNLGLGQPCGSCGAPNRCDGVCWQGSGYSGWTWIPNGPNNVPSPGDLVSYHECPSERIDSASGHVDIFVSGNASSFTSFAQNWGGEYCHLVPHDYGCVTGWQHPGVSPAPAPAPAQPPATCSPTCDSCSTCQGTRCVSSCPAGWSCAGGLCSPPPAPSPSPSPAPPPPATPSAWPAAVAGLALAALTGLAAWQAVRRRPGPGLGGGASRSYARTATAAGETPLTPSAAAHGLGGGA